MSQTIASNDSVNFVKSKDRWKISGETGATGQMRQDGQGSLETVNDSKQQAVFHYTDNLDLKGRVLTLDFEFLSVPERESSAGIRIGPKGESGGGQLEIVIHPYEEFLVLDGQKKNYKPLVEDPYRFVLVIRVTGHTASIFLGSQLLGEKGFEAGGPVSLALLVSRATVKWNELHSSAPCADTYADVTLERPEKTAQIPSPWISYFGTHFATSPEGSHEYFSICRHYGGVWMGISPEASERGGPGGEKHKGPFTGRDIGLRIEDFRSQRPTDVNRDRTAVEIIPEAIRNQIDIVYTIKTIVPPVRGPFDKDLLYWTVRLIHERFPEAKDRIYWQIGNELLGGHFDPLRNMEKYPVPPYKSRDGRIRGYAIDWKVDYYVNDYFAPAAESIRKASEDVYGNPDAIRMLIGSVNPYNEENLEFLDRMLDSTIDGRQAPSLAGMPLLDICNSLTVHYMFRRAEETTLLDTMDKLAGGLSSGKFSKVWMTEEHGNRGQGPVTMLRTCSLFMDWVARHGLNSDQAKIIWFGDNTTRPGGNMQEVMARLTAFLGGKPLEYFRQETADAFFYLLKTGARTCVIVIPRKARSLALANLIIPRHGSGEESLSARAIQYSPVQKPEEFDLSASSQNDRIVVSCHRLVENPLLLFLEPK